MTLIVRLRQEVYEIPCPQFMTRYLPCAQFDLSCQFIIIFKIRHTCNYDLACQRYMQFVTAINPHAPAASVMGATPPYPLSPAAG
jgi:hypothetical protein